MHTLLRTLDRLANTYCGICGWWTNCDHPR
jgi:hypothetical protein